MKFKKLLYVPFPVLSEVIQKSAKQIVTANYSKYLLNRNGYAFAFACDISIASSQNNIYNYVKILQFLRLVKRPRMNECSIDTNGLVSLSDNAESSSDRYETRTLIFTKQ